MAVLQSQPITSMSMPGFQLADAAGQVWTANELMGRNGTLVVFMCNHCPYVQHVAEGLGRLAHQLQARDINTVGINSNDPKRVPEDDSAKMQQFAEENDFSFPYLVDADQVVARAYGAVCTPDFFLFDRQGQLFYRGQMDGSRPGNGVEVTGSDILNAATLLLAGHPAPSPQRPSIGCSIKWRRVDEIT